MRATQRSPTGNERDSRILRRVSRDRHHRAVTVGLGDLDRADRAAAPLEADLAHHSLHGGLGGLQGEPPAALGAVERDLVIAAQRREVARERRAYALDESPDLGMLAQRESAALVA